VGARQLVFAVVIAVPTSAHAGRTFYGWLQDTQVMPERGAEIATFISEENYLEEADRLRDTTWWIGPSIGINDQLELTLPVEFAWDRSDHSPPRSNFTNYGAEIKYRFVTADPVDKPDFAPAVRVGVKRIVIGPRDVWQPELNFIGSYETGIFHSVIDLGLVGDVGPDSHHFEAHPGVGVSIEAIEDIRLGAEVFAELSLDDNGDGSWAVVGPNISWSHGRSWLSASYGIGIYKVRDAPKLNWGIAF
jgi:hypothetical protein